MNNEHIHNKLVWLIFYFIIGILVSCSYVIETSQEAVAQSNITYIKNGISISHPFNWKGDEGIGKYNIVTFLAPSANSSKLHPAEVGIYRQQLTNSTDDLHLFYIYSSAQIRYINKSYEINSINSTNHLNSNPAIEVSFKYNGANAICIWTVKNAYAYMVIYAADNASFSKYLQTFRGMENSFKLAASSKD